MATNHGEVGKNNLLYPGKLAWNHPPGCGGTLGPTRAMGLCKRGSGRRGLGIVDGKSFRMLPT